MTNIILAYTQAQKIMIIVILAIVALVAAYLLYLTLTSGKKKESQKDLQKKYKEQKKASRPKEEKKVEKKEPKKEEKVVEEVRKVEPEQQEEPEEVVEETKEEPVVEEVTETPEETKEEPAVEEVAENTEETKEESTDEEAEEENDTEVVFDEVTNTTVTIRYVRSFEAKLRNASDETRNYYNSLKQEILSYSNVKSRMSFKHETFKVGRDTYVKFMIRGKSLCVYFNLDPKDYLDTKYKIKDVSDKTSQADTPVMYKISNDRRFKYTYDLISNAFVGSKAVKGNLDTTDYIKDYEPLDRDTLISMNLIKVVKTVK